MKKILHLADTKSINVPGGVETVIRNCLNHPPSGCSGQFVNSCSLKSFTILGKSIPSKKKLKNIIKEYSPDVIHLHGSTPFIWRSIQIIKNLKPKIVITPFFHQPKFTNKPFLSYLNMIILKMTLAKGVRVHFCSEYERRLFKKIKNFNTFIFPPFFISEEKSKTHHKSDILFVGRDDEHKGLDEFVEVSKYFPNENFIAVTNPRRKINHDSNLTIKSNVSDDELEVVYKKTKILIFPSGYESFGGVFLEALSNGCIVICSNMILGTEFFSKNENLFFYKYSLDKSKNIKEINRILGIIFKNNTTFKEYNDDNKERNSIKVSDHIKSYNSLYS